MQGAELIYQDNEWSVYHILNYDGTVKYGKNTQWCITGTNLGSLTGEEYWDNYTLGGDIIYYYILINLKTVNEH